MTGNPSLDKVIALINLLGVGAGLGLFIYTGYVQKRPLPQERVELEKLKEDQYNQATLDSVKFDRITVNLPSRATKLNFLDLQMNVLPFNVNQIEKINQNKALVLDVAIDLAGRMSASELNTVSGKILLESKMKREINFHLGSPVIKRIYFTKFTIQ